MLRADLLQLYLRLGLTPIPLKPHSKEPLVRWANAWHPTHEGLEAWVSRPDINRAMCCNPRPEDQERWSSGRDFNWRIRSRPNQAISHFNSIEAFYVCSSDPTYFGQEVDHG